MPRFKDSRTWVIPNLSERIKRLTWHASHRKAARAHKSPTKSKLKSNATGFHQLIEMVIDEKYYVFHQLLRSQRVGENGTEPNSRESLLEHVASKIDLVLRNVVLHDGFVSG
ncbi:hypothetical protein RB195_004898 [Necator americanus]|uniref:Uncharacterized protein n=1 Tax=Necator americanus TaxID=51031 RepID=A0ABR1BNL2_NECAM